MKNAILVTLMLSLGMTTLAMPAHSLDPVLVWPFAYSPLRPMVWEIGKQLPTTNIGTKCKVIWTDLEYVGAWISPRDLLFVLDSRVESDGIYSELLLQLRQLDRFGQARPRDLEIKIWCLLARDVKKLSLKEIRSLMIVEFNQAIRDSFTLLSGSELKKF